ncbi:hypothetical protein BHE74_00054122 [Ensete ventricosum]|nr:hypothetical protein GW17_00003630 [Ensete ventricosum]RWW40470.1 hypothetical protein BHE74_00054122 [Ensete ventricosum]
MRASRRCHSWVVCLGRRNNTFDTRFPQVVLSKSSTKAGGRQSTQALLPQSRRFSHTSIGSPLIYPHPD